MKQNHHRRMLLDVIFLVVLNVLGAAYSVPQTRPTIQNGDLTFNISTPLEFKGHIVSGPLRKSEIAGLLDLPVRNGDSDINDGFGVGMTGPNHEQIMVYSCLQWKKARQEKAYSATTYDMAMEGFLIHTCGLLFELQKAMQPAKSFVSNPKVSLADFDLIPAEILSAIGAREKARLRGLTLSKLVATKDIEKTDDNRITLSYGGVRQSFWEGARADFNGDGIEDILVFTGGRAEGGTMGYSDYFFLTRTSPSGPLKVIRPRIP